MKKVFILPVILLFALHAFAQLPVALTVSAGADQVVCTGTAIHLTTLTNGGDGNYSFRWTPSFGLSDSAMPDPMAYPDNTTTYVLTVTDLSGHSATDTLVITVDQPYGVVTSSGNQILCAGDSLQLTVHTDPANAIFWNNGEQSPSIWVKESGDYMAMVTSPAGCMVFADNDVLVMALSVPETPQIIASGTTELCVGDTITLVAANTSGFTDYSWSTGAIDTSITVSDPGVYSLRLYDFYGCPSQPATVNVNVHPLPTGYIVPDASTRICAGDSLHLTVNADASASYTWNTGATSASIFVTGAGTYGVKITSAYGCVNDATNTVTTFVQPVPVPVLTQQGNKLSLAAPATSYQWYLDGQLLQGNNDPSLEIKKGGMYSVRVMNNGCPSTASLKGVLNIVDPGVEYQVYPNPVEQELHIFYNLKDDQKTNISLYDVMGKRIALFADNERQSKGMHEYHLSRANKAIQTGIYTLTLEFGSKRIVRQILFR